MTANAHCKLTLGTYDQLLHIIYDVLQLCQLAYMVAELMIIRATWRHWWTAGNIDSFIKPAMSANTRLVAALTRKEKR